jgi:hypothetical protein
MKGRNGFDTVQRFGCVLAVLDGILNRIILIHY